MAQFIEFVGNNLLLFGAFIVILLVLIYQETQSQAGGLKLLLPQQATQTLNHQHGVVFDLRDEEAYKKGHILGALNITTDDFEKLSKKQKKYLQKPVILCTANGQLSPKVARNFKQAGFENIFALKGGIQAWTGANMPLTTG